MQSCAPRVVPVLSLPSHNALLLSFGTSFQYCVRIFEWEIVVVSSEFSIISDEKFKITTLRHQQKKEKGYHYKIPAEIAQEEREAAFIERRHDKTRVHVASNSSTFVNI